MALGERHRLGNKRYCDLGVSVLSLANCFLPAIWSTLALMLSMANNFSF